jgi:O-acetylserine/cysteine efflux transporter
MLRIHEIIQLLIIITVWGLGFIVIKISVAEAPPIFLSAMRFVFAAFPAVFLLPRPKVPLLHLAGYGLFLCVIQYGLLFLAIKLGLPAGLSSLLMQLQAFFTIGLSVIIFKDHATWPQFVAIIIAFVGCAVIASERLEGAALMPLLMVLVAALSWGIANVISKHSKGIDMLAYVAWSSLFAPIPLFGISYLSEGKAAFVHAITHIDALILGVSAYSGWIATIGGFGLWAGLLSHHRTALIAPFTLLVPVVGFIGGALVFHERITTLETIGAVIIFAGLALNIYALNRNPDPNFAKEVP